MLLKYTAIHEWPSKQYPWQHNSIDSGLSSYSKVWVWALSRRC